MRLWSALSLILGALLLGTTFAHVLEIRSKAALDGPLWTTMQKNLYGAFATVGGAVEIGAILSTAALALTVPAGTGRWVAGAAFLGFALAFAVVWIGVVAPVNRRVAKWDPAIVPEDWRRWRRQWDAGHAIRFVLHLLAFGLLVWVVVFSSPGVAAA